MASSRRPSGRVTIADVAKRAGVSTGAVSYALNGRAGVSEATRERVLRVADELGWAPTSAARSLVESKTDTFGLVLARDPQNLGVESFYMRFLAGLEAELSKRSYSLLLQLVPTVEDEVLTLKKWISSRRVDGVILVDLAVDDPRIPLFTSEGAIPCVAVGDPSVTFGLPTVWTDDASSMREAVRHLAGLGHRRIARVSGLAPFAHTLIRDEAFTVQTSAMGLVPVLLRSDYSPSRGAVATREALLSPEPPTAFIYDNDVMAVAGLSAAAELGRRVPDDVSIVAWDDSVLCEYTFPRLTALSHDVVSFGAHVGRRMFGVIDGAEPGAFLDSTPSLRVRGSVGPA